ncbi:putative F-box protein [Helianthus anomalus]
MGIPKRTRKIINDDTSLSVRRHEEKRVRKLVHPSTTSVGSLPRDLLVDVLGRVASSSFTDLFNAKLSLSMLTNLFLLLHSCKDFLESTTNDYISQRISIEKFSITNWFTRNKRVIAFLSQCFNKGNPESLFRKGMIDYFTSVNVESGLLYLKRAVEKGHLEATYVYGMILFSSGDQQGLKLLNSMNCSRSRRWNARGCRDKIDSIFKQIWINNPVTLAKVNTKCRERNHAIRFERRG